MCIRNKRGQKTKQKKVSERGKKKMSTEQISAETVGSDKTSINHKSTSLETQGRQMKIAGCRCSQSAETRGR